MKHDEFVGKVQHLAELPSRGAAETVIRATFETLGERLPQDSAAHLAAQLPPELGRHLIGRPFAHLSLREFTGRVAERERADVEKAAYHARCVMETLCTAISPGAVHKLRVQLPGELQPLLGMPQR